MQQTAEISDIVEIKHEQPRNNKLQVTAVTYNIQDCLSLEGRPHTNRTHKHAFCSCDLDLDPMTLMYEFDVDNLKTYPGYPCTKMKFVDQCFQELEPQQDRQTDRRD